MKYKSRSLAVLVLCLVTIQLACCQDASSSSLKHTTASSIQQPEIAVLGKGTHEEKQLNERKKLADQKPTIRQHLKQKFQLNSSKIDAKQETVVEPTLVTPPLARDTVVVKTRPVTMPTGDSTNIGGDKTGSVISTTIRSTPTQDNLVQVVDKLETEEHQIDESVLADVTDLDELDANIKENLLKKSSAQSQQNANLTPPSSLKTEEPAKMAPVSGESKGQEEASVPIETSSETAKVLETMTSTTPPQEPPKVIETTSTDSILNLTQTPPLKQEPPKPADNPTKAETSWPKEEAKTATSETPVTKEATAKPKTEIPSDVKFQKFHDKEVVAEAKEAKSTSSEATLLKEPVAAEAPKQEPPKPVQDEPAKTTETPAPAKEEPAKTTEAVVPVQEEPAKTSTEVPAPVKEEPTKAEPAPSPSFQEPSKPAQEEPVKPVQEIIVLGPPQEPVEIESKPAKAPTEPETKGEQKVDPPATEAPQVTQMTEEKPAEVTEAPTTPAPVVEPETTVAEVTTNQPETSSTAQIQEETTTPVPVQLNEAWNKSESSLPPIEVILEREDSGASQTVERDSSFLDSRLVIDTNDYRPSESRPRPQLTRNPDLEKATKFCTDMSPIRDLFADHIEPLYMPVVGMMPESLQTLLLDQTSVGGLRTASCGLLLFVFFTVLISCLLVARRGDFAQLSAMNELNETVIVLDNLLKKAQFEKQSFETQLRDLEIKHVIVEEQLNIKEEQLQQIQMDRAQKDNSATLSTKELEKLKNSESKLQKELKSAMLELNQLQIQLEQEKKDFEVKLSQAEGSGNERMVALTAQLEEAQVNLNENRQFVFNQNIELEQLRYSEAELAKKLEEKERTLEMLQSCLVREKQVMTNGKHHNGEEDDESSQSNGVSLDELMKSAELKMKIKQLENELETERANLQAKTLEMGNLESKLREHDLAVEKLKKKQHETDKSLKEQEMQVKLLNELREKDTKQHLKSYAELDAQLKKKSSDADKATHLLDQLRIKQERIQELESQFSRIEKQSTLERQTFEKQAHENWLSARKFEKELKESKNEINTLKERLAEIEQFKINDNTLIRPIANKQYYMSPVQQQQVTAAAKKSSESSPKAPSLNADNETTSVQANLASTSSIGLDAASTSLNAPVADLPLQIDTTNNLPSSGSLHERPASVSSNPGQGYPVNGNPVAPLMYNPYVRSQYRMPYAPGAFMPDQRSSPDVMASAAANPAFYNQVPRMPMPHPAHVYRMYQQQQYLQQQQQQQQQQQYQLNSSSSQQGSPRASNNQPLSSQSNHHIPFSNSFNGSLNDESTAHLTNTAAATAETSLQHNNDHDFSLQVNNEPMNDSQRGNSLNV